MRGKSQHVGRFIIGYVNAVSGIDEKVAVLLDQQVGPRFQDTCLSAAGKDRHLIGSAFLVDQHMTLGMLSGAVWAKEAWGHYWSWDPKETWAAATWFSYLIYIHFRLGKPLLHRKALILLLISFVLLQMCWYGINYLPSAQGVSIHTYNLN